MKFNIKNLCGVVTALTIATTTLVGCGNENISNKVSTDGSTSMEKVIGLLGEYYQELIQMLYLHIIRQVLELVSIQLNQVEQISVYQVVIYQMLNKLKA